MRKTDFMLRALRDSLWFQLGLWALAVALSAQLASAWQERTRVQAMRSGLHVPSIDVRSAALKKDDYLAVRERVGRAHADNGVLLSAQDDGLTVKAAHVDSYLQWRLALADVMMSMPGTVWTVKSLCAGEKCPEGHFHVVLSGSLRNFAVVDDANLAAAQPAAASPAVSARR